jgi:hypothetical protein
MLPCPDFCGPLWGRNAELDELEISTDLEEEDGLVGPLPCPDGIRPLYLCFDKYESPAMAGDFRWVYISELVTVKTLGNDGMGVLWEKTV